MVVRSESPATNTMEDKPHNPKDLRETYLMLKKILYWLDNPEQGLHGQHQFVIDGVDPDLMTLAQLKRYHVRRRIVDCGSKLGAADSLSVNPKTIYNILKK